MVLVVEGDNVASEEYLHMNPLALSNAFGCRYQRPSGINSLPLSRLLTGINVNSMEVYEVPNQYEDNEHQDSRPEGNFSDEAQDSD